MIRMYRLRCALNEPEFHERFYNVVGAIIALKVHHLSEYSGASPEKMLLRAEKEKNTANWVGRELIRLNKTGHFIAGFVDLHDENAVRELIEDVYDAAFELMDCVM